MFDNEMRKKLIKSLIRTYYQFELNADNIVIGSHTYETLEFEMQRLMTNYEYDLFMDSCEFDGEYWSKI